jgi:hypothetical protein
MCDFDTFDQLKLENRITIYEWIVFQIEEFYFERFHVLRTHCADILKPLVVRPFAHLELLWNKLDGYNGSFSNRNK